jgi:signal transduction histidine kinase
VDKLSPRTSSRLAWSLFAISAVVIAADVVLQALSWSTPTPSAFGFGSKHAEIAFAIALLSYPAMGAIVTSRQPHNRIGWLFCLLGVFGAGIFMLAHYGTYAVITSPGALPAGETVLWAATWAWSPGFLIVTLLLLLFPDGRVLSRRWRLVVWAAAVGAAATAVSDAFGPRSPTPQLPVANPMGIESAKDLLQGLYVLGSVLGGLALVAAATSLVVRFRHAGREQRQQLKWFMYSSLFFAVVVLPSTLFYESLENFPVLSALAYFSALAIPVSAGLAVLKYRLYDIDIVINRTLVYGALAAFITVVYLAIVLGVGALVGSRGNVALSIVATAVIALAFQPARERARHLANRLVYGAQAAPYELLSEFSERVAGTYATQEVLSRMARILGEATGAARTEVWLAVGKELRPEASWPDWDGQRPKPLLIVETQLPELIQVDRAVPVIHEGELLGALTVKKRSGEQLSPVEEKLLSDLARQAGLVLRNSRLTSELQARLDQISAQAAEIQASRQRIVTAQDRERRRLERDIHDGAQQQLVSMAVKLRLARELIDRKPEKAAEILDGVIPEANETLETLRDLARGIFPPLLTDRGLMPALEAHVAKYEVPARIEASNGVSATRFDPHVEAAVYFCCLEAIQNSTKHASGSPISVQLSARDGWLEFSVSDQGPGFEPTSIAFGTGLQSMTDRIQAIGGKFEVASALGKGTKITGRVPASAMQPVG